jgi:outer membrane immunogenic protein
VKTTLAAAAAILIATTAAGSAADMAVKAPYAAPIQIWSWTGFYVGAHAGAGWGTTESSIDLAGLGGGLGLGGGVGSFPIAQNNKSGFLGGGQIGYNFQSGWAVFGVQADIAGLDVKGTTPCLFVASCTGETNWLATVTGRVGGVVADKTLIYIKGGAAWLNSTHSMNLGALAGLGGAGALTGLSADSTALGWLLGFGAEYAITQNVSAFIEYDYMDFDKKTVGFNVGAAGLGALNVPVTVQTKLSIAKIGVNYKF